MKETNINFVNSVCGENNDYLRKSNDVNSNGYIFDTSFNAARNIVNELVKKTTRSHHVMLLAKMQSGKTSVCNATINLINHTKLAEFMGIKKYLFITGMNDCGLKEQTYIRLKEQVFDADDNNIYLNRGRAEKERENKFFVLKNSDLLSLEENIENSIIFIDESHYGSNEHNVLTKFLMKNNINWRNPIDLVRRNIYIVSVSATPFDEIVSDKANCKKMIELKTNNAYVGITQYLNNGLINDAEKDDIKNGNIFNYIKDAKERMDINGHVGAIIIRTRNFNVISDDEYVKANFDIMELMSSRTSIDYNALNREMERIVEYNKSNANNTNIKVRPIIVLIKGAFRAGITIPQDFKDYIYMIYDYSLKADTTAQALLGRMCGYRSTRNGFLNTHFYLNKKFADMYSEWENDFQSKDKIPYSATKWVWVDKDYEGETKLGSKCCGNITINLTEDEIKEIYNTLKNRRNKLNIMENIFPNILSAKNITLPYDYMSEVLMGGKNNYADSSHCRRFDGFTSDLLAFPFRPEKIKKFHEDTNRDYLTKEDIGKKCVSLVLDAEIYNKNGEIDIKGNKRILVYYAEVGHKALKANADSLYKTHKDTNLI